MFALSKYGAQVLHDKSILTAKKNNVKVEVLSSMLSNSIGTIVKNVENHRANPISGIAVLNHIAKITITDIYDKSIFYNNIFSELKKSGINVDTSFSTVEKKQNNFIIFAVDETKLDETIKILEKYFPEKDNIFYDKNKSIISTVALSDTININIASIIFEILEEIKKHPDKPYVYLDLTHLDKNFLMNRFPFLYNACAERGYYMEKDLLPVAPAHHYAMGGIKINLYGETSLNSLYALGEAACTGVHGNNRLASNSLLEGIVFGYRCAKKINSELFVTNNSSYPSKEDVIDYLKERVDENYAKLLDY